MALAPNLCLAPGSRVGKQHQVSVLAVLVTPGQRWPVGGGGGGAGADLRQTTSQKNCWETLSCGCTADPTHRQHLWGLQMTAAPVFMDRGTQGCIGGEEGGGGGWGGGGRGGGVVQEETPPPPMASVLEGRRNISSKKKKPRQPTELRPRAKENVSPENPTENPWAGSCIGRGGGRVITSGCGMAGMVLASCQTTPLHMLPCVAEWFALLLSQRTPDQDLYPPPPPRVHPPPPGGEPSLGP